MKYAESKCSGNVNTCASLKLYNYMSKSAIPGKFVFFSPIL